MLLSGLILLIVLVAFVLFEVGVLSWIARDLRTRWWLAVVWLVLPIGIGLLRWGVPVAQTVGPAVILLLIIASSRGWTSRFVAFRRPANSILLVPLGALALPFALLGIWIGLRDGTYAMAALLTILVVSDVVVITVMLMRQLRLR